MLRLKNLQNPDVSLKYKRVATSFTDSLWFSSNTRASIVSSSVMILLTVFPVASRTMRERYCSLMAK